MKKGNKGGDDTMTTMLEGEQEVQQLRERVEELKAELYNVENRYISKLKMLQHHCQKAGHQFITEKEDDYHRTRYYYRCRRCEYFTC